MLSRRFLTRLTNAAVAAVGVVTLIAGALGAGTASAQDPTSTPLPRAYVVNTDAYVLPYGTWVNLTLETRGGSAHEATVTRWEFYDPTGAQPAFADWQPFADFPAYAVSNGNHGRFVVPDDGAHAEWAFRAQITDPQGRTFTVGPTASVEWKAANDQPIADVRQMMDRIPGGGFAALFLVPVAFAGIIAVGTKSPVGTTIAGAGAMGAMIIITDASPFLWVLVVAAAAGGVLVSIQMGFGRAR